MTLKSKKRFVDGRTDVRTCVRTDIWDRLYQIDSVEESILKGSIADLSPLVDVNGFVRSWLPSNTCSSISRKSDHQMASQSVQPLLYSTSVWPKHKQTDTHTHTHTETTLRVTSVATGHAHICAIHAMQPKKAQNRL